MRKVMVFQHVGHEPLGTLNPRLKAAGFRIRYVNFGRHPDSTPSLDGYSGLIVLGGPMGVYQVKEHGHLKVEMALIEQALKRNIPVLGICLGAQLIASVLGAEVRKAPEWEIGWSEIHLTESGTRDSLLQSYRSPEKIFQLHQDTFDTPKAAVHLARSAACDSQAFRYGDRVYGLQFHLEADRPMIRRWMHRPENIELVSSVHGPEGGARIELETEAHIERALALGRMTFDKFIEMFPFPGKLELLGSDHGKPHK